MKIKTRIVVLLVLVILAMLLITLPAQAGIPGFLGPPVKVYPTRTVPKIELSIKPVMPPAAIP